MMSTIKKISFLFMLLAISNFTWGQCEELVWQDEFDGSSLDLNKWGYETGDGCPELCQWGTGQLDYSTDRQENVRVEGGNLYLTVQKEDDPSQFNGRDYTSGRIRTYQKVDFKYGRMEARLKGVKSQGFGFAFWLLGSDYETTTWPKCGEVDIFEQTGKWPEHNIGTTHFQEAWGHAMNQGSVDLTGGENFADEFHTVGLIWTPDSMSWYLGTPENIYHTFYYQNGINNYDPFNREFFIILSVGMGGDYSGGPDETTLTSQSAVIDYVRVWEGPYSVELTGTSKLYESTTGNYNITQVDGASYSWEVPAGATITNGQGSNQIEVLWETPEASGDVLCTVSTGCFTQTYSKTVIVEASLVIDNIFEDAEDNRNIAYGAFSGSLEEAVANPEPNSVNNSSTVVRHGRDGGTEWDYVVIENFNPGHAGRYIQGTNRLFLDVYSDAPAGTKITLGFEDADVAVPEDIYGKHSNYEAYTTVQNEWETLEFILTGIPFKYTGSYNVDKAVLMFDPGVINANTFYFDNFRSGMPGGEAPIISTVTLEDWDGNSSIELLTAAGNYQANVANPNPSGINTSASVLSYTRDASNQYDEFSYEVSFEDASLFKKGINTISFDVYTGAETGKIVSMHMVDSTQVIYNWDSQIHSIYETKITKQNEWEHVVFYWSSTPNAAVPNVNVNKLVFKIDELSNNGDTYFIDNIQVNSTEAPPVYVLDKVVDNFEDIRNLNYVYAGDPYEINITNPAPNDVNPSALVAYYNRGYNVNDWLVYSLAKEIDADALREEEKIMSVDVYTDAPVGTLFTVGLEANDLATPDNWPTGRHSDYASATKKQNEWHTINFIFSSSADGSTPSHKVDKMVLTANQGINTPYNIYLDNFKIHEKISDTVLSSINVTPNLIENVSINQVINFMGEGFDQFGDVFPTNLTWSVNGGGVINAETGQFTATQNGVWKVTAQDGNIRGTADVLIGEGIQLQSISISPANSTIYETEQKQLNARGLDQLGRIFELNNISWSSSNTSIASVDQNGLVNSYVPGTVTFTASQSGIEATAEIVVRATPVLTSISISPEAKQIYLDETLQFSAATQDQYDQNISVNLNWAVSAGYMDNGLFTPTSIGTFSVSVSSDELAASTYVTVLERPINLALNKLPIVSTTQGGTEAVWATDGDASTKWGSDWVDPSWIYVDLGAEYDLTEVVLNWEAAYGKVYNVQVSNDGIGWNTAYHEPAGNGGIDNISINETARFVRIEGIERGTDYGYSLYEFEVYGLPHSTPTLTSMHINPYKTSIDQGETLAYTAQGFDQFGNLMGVAPTWSANGGDMNNGYYNANQNGNFEITANQNGVTAHATIEVIQVIVPVLTTLELTPNTAKILEDETVQFSVNGLDQFGVNYPLAYVNWSSSCGTIDNGLYTGTTIGNCTITAESEGILATALVTVDKKPNPGCNLISQGKPATTSSVEGDYSAANAVDGNMNTRWGTNFNDNEWLMVDLQGSYSICEVKLYWEGAYGKDYEIRLGTSNNMDAAQVIASVIDGNGDEDIVSTSQSVSGQYLFLKGIARGTGWGYSLWEMEVYGTDGNGQLIDPTANAGSDITITLPTNSTDLIGNQSFDTDGVITTYNWTYVSGPSIPTISNTSSATANVSNLVQGVYEFRLQVTDNDNLSDEDIVIVTVLDEPTGNIAAFKPVTASSTQAGLNLSELNDENMGTRWGSDWNDDEWVQIDLQAEYAISQVVLEWEGAFGRDYEIQISNDETFASYTVIASVLNSDGGRDEVSTNSTSGRYLRMKGIARGTGYGYSLWEFEAYGTTIKKGVVSSQENNAPIFNLNLYPNPATSDLNIRISNTQTLENNIKIIDLVGRCVMQKQISNSDKINISNLNKGKYLVIITNENSKFTQMIVKQ